MGLKLDIVLTLNNADAVASGLTNVGTKVEGVGVKVRKSGKDLEDGLGGVGAQLQRMQGFLLGFVAFDKLKDWTGQAIQMADGWALLNAKLEVATGSQIAAQASMGGLFTLAQDLRVPLSETATLFGRLTPALREFGGGTAEAMRMTEALSLSLKVSGATQAEAGSAMLQFSQAMSAGALRGEEFNSMADAAPRLLQALADGLGVSRGALKGMAEEGKLTTDVVYEALSKQLPTLEAEFGKLPITVDDAWTKMGNSVMKVIGELNAGGGYTESLSKGIMAVSDALPGVITDIQLFSVTFISMLQGTFVNLTYYANVAWEGMKFGFVKFFVDGVRLEFSGFLDLIASGLALVGADSWSAKFQGWATAMEKPIYSAEEYNKKLTDLETQRNKEINLIDDVVTDLFIEANNREKVASAANKEQSAKDKLTTTTKLSAAESKKLETQFDKLTKALGDQTISLQRSADGQKQLTKTQELTAKASEFLTSMGDKLTASQRQQLKAFVDTLPQLEKQSEAALKLAKAQEEHKRKLDDSLKSLDADLQKAIEERDSLGKTEIQVRQLSVQRDRETLATLQARAAKESHNEALQHEIGVLEQRIAKGEQLIVVLKDTEGWKAQQKQIEENTEYWNNFTDEIGRNFTDGFQRMLEDGKGGWDSFTDSIKNTFKRVLVDWIYKAFAKPIILNIQAAMSGGASGGLLGGGGGLGGLQGLMNMASGGFGKIAASLGGAISGFGNLIGSSTLQQFGGGMTVGYGNGSLASSLGAKAGAAMPWVAGIGAGLGVGGLISGDYSLGGNKNIATGIGTALGAALGGPLGAALGGSIGGLVNRAFGTGPKKVQSFGIEGTFSGEDFDGNSYQKWKKKGGWFSSSKYGTDRSDLDTEVDGILDAGFSTLKTNISGFAKSLGIDASKLANFSKKISLELSEDEAENSDRIAKLFDGMADEMTRRIAPKVSYFRRDGETIAQTFERLAGVFDVTNAATSLLGANWEAAFSNMNIGSSTARQALIDFSGGLEAFSQKVNFYYENFYTDAEKNSRAFAELDARFDKLGVSLELNKESFRAAMEQIEIANDPARYAAFLDIAPLFTQLLSSMGDSAIGKTIGVGANAEGLTEKQLANINQGVDSWWQTYQPELKAQTTQAELTTSAIVDLQKITAEQSARITAEIASGNTLLQQAVAGILSSGLMAEAQSKAIESVLNSLGKRIESSMENAVVSTTRQ